MKKYSIILAALVVAGFTSCKGKVEKPDSAKFSWYFNKEYVANQLDLSKVKANPDTIELSDVLCFVADGGADSYVVWPGEAKTDYLKRSLPDSLLDGIKISDKDLDKNGFLDTIYENRVSLKASGVALYTVDAMGRNVKTYSFSSISPVGSPFQMYATSRNYDYELGEYAETVSGPFHIVVIDTQVDLWDPNSSDPKNSTSTSYSIIVQVEKAVNSNTFYRITKASTGAAGSYDLVIDDAKPGVNIIYPKGSNPGKCIITLKVNNCIPKSTDGSIIVVGSSYKWTVDLSTDKTLTLCSQSATADAGSGDPLTKNYTFHAVESAE